MARAVKEAFGREKFLIAEAGTGTGKTLAYLIPAILSGKRVVVSTGTKTLQEQLFFKDLPFIAQGLGLPFRASFMKGRGNYLCRRRFRLFTRQPFLNNPAEIPFFEALKEWAGRTKTGDRAELEGLPEDLDLWKEICAQSETCLGQACPEFERCHITRMRQEAAGSDLIIVNHHLFFADLAVRKGGYGEVLPRYEAVIFDEAHQLEEVATSYLGLTVSNFRFEELARDMRREAASKPPDRLLAKGSEELLEIQERFFQFFRRGDSRRRLRPKMLPPPVREQASRLLEKLTWLAAHIGAGREPSEELRALGRRAEELSRQFQEVLGLAQSGYVYWVEVRGRGVFLHSSPVDVSTVLKAHLFDRLKAAVFTSATLSARGSFAFFRQRLGLDGEVEEKILASSFDLGRQAILYLPRKLPDPNLPAFILQAAGEVEQILRNTRGRAFLLFTSLKYMEEMHRLLKSRLPFTCFLQGERPKSALIQAFREDTHSVLFASASFWEGVDVKGEALSCVIVDRLPFSPPNDPILEARLEQIASEGKSPFWEYQVPAAIILLKQGLGRLIRNRQDRGVLAVLDPRLTSKGYGRAFLESLPPCPLVRESEAIARFLGDPEAPN
ncbi:MAG: ATP-dependent DNA helicase [Deltaproteobacteria bacterium]|nr:ATP-dependent DNA helicase [Deltaproteobacteria bacterium]